MLGKLDFDLYEHRHFVELFRAEEHKYCIIPNPTLYSSLLVSYQITFARDTDSKIAKDNQSSGGKAFSHIYI